MSDEYLALPIDADSTRGLAAQGLRFGLVDVEQEEFLPWMGAVSRGFLEPHPRQAVIDARRGRPPYRRITGVWDDSLADAATPVATASSWPTELTVPGATSVTGWAISTITVSPTHRRRGIARAMLEAELRTARTLGVPLAILTASEATIYRRWGFAPAAMTASWTIDTGRARWTGPETSGRVQFVTGEQLLLDGPAILERVRLTVPGLIEFGGHLWERLLGVGDDDAPALRCVRYDDADGVPQGFAVYTIPREETHSGNAIAEVRHCVAATDDAYAALWRFLFELDLVREVRAGLRPVAEPFAWQISDYRAAVKSRERDHLWVRLLDVAAALEARRYAAAGRIVLDISDPLGFTEGLWLLNIADDGSGSVTQLEDGIPGDAAVVALGVNELDTIYLGGVSATLLARAGAITEITANAASVIDASFRSAVTPWSSIWF